MKNFLLALSLISLTRCSFIFPTPRDKTLVVLTPAIPCAPKEENVTGKTPSPQRGVLLLRSVTASGLIDSSKILFNRKPETRGSYQLTGWSESPTRQLSDLMFRTFNCRPGFRAVTKGLEPVGADLSLTTEIVDFRHDASAEPGKAVLAIRVELIDLRSRSLLGSTLFEYSTPLENSDAENARQGLSNSVGVFLAWITRWVESLTPRTEENTRS